MTNEPPGDPVSFAGVQAELDAVHGSLLSGRGGGAPEARRSVGRARTWARAE
jgi:hypothetical protein